MFDCLENSLKGTGFSPYIKLNKTGAALAAGGWFLQISFLFAVFRSL
jgi:hypothetical protein